MSPFNSLLTSGDKMSAIELRSITTEDLEFARAIRNHFRHCFVDDREISSAQQHEWYKRIASDCDVDFRIIWLNDIRVGTISATQRKNLVEIGNVAVLPEFQGRGIAAEAERLMVKADVCCFGTYLSPNITAVAAMRRSGIEPIPIRKEIALDIPHARSPILLHPASTTSDVVRQ